MVGEGGAVFALFCARALRAGGFAGDAAYGCLFFCGGAWVGARDVVRGAVGRGALRGCGCSRRAVWLGGLVASSLEGSMGAEGPMSCFARSRL